MQSRRHGGKSSEPARIRIQRVLADAGIASRRASEALVEEGAVTVNGRIVEGLPCFVDPNADDIRVSGRRVEKRRRHHYIMLFKPRGYVCTSRDPQGRKRALDLVQHPSGSRLFSVGRLDLESSGLLLLTDDGELANRLTHPRYGVHKGYDVTVRGRLDDEAIDKARRGLYLVDRRTGEATRTAESDLVVLKRDRERTRLYIALREGRNRQIRRVMDRVGHPVRKLRRVQMGPLKLKGLAIGEWRELTPGELGALRRATKDNAPTLDTGPNRRIKQVSTRTPASSKRSRTASSRSSTGTSTKGRSGGSGRSSGKASGNRSVESSGSSKRRGRIERGHDGSKDNSSNGRKPSSGGGRGGRRQRPGGSRS
ncbi:MAG: pseudouridine synthase [Planctomycetota bacterium]|nr:pseudouridine synthase [Planctomycetota bacterium]